MEECTRPDVKNPCFARRLGHLLATTRRDRRCSCRSLASESAGQFSARDLRSIEAGEYELDDVSIERISALYRADLGVILPGREGVLIEGDLLSVGGVSAQYSRGDPNSLLSTYLKLVRSLRRQQRAPVVELRTQDVERLADHLQLPGEQVVVRLAALMGATVAQRSSMISLFGSGAVVIGILVTLSAGGGSVAAAPSSEPSALTRGSPHETPAAVVVEIAAPQAGNAVVHHAAPSGLVVDEPVGQTRDFGSLTSALLDGGAAPAATDHALAVVPSPQSSDSGVHDATEADGGTAGGAPEYTISQPADTATHAPDLHPAHRVGETPVSEASGDTEVGTAIAPDGSQVATDVGVGDASTPVPGILSSGGGVLTAVAPDGSLVAVDLGTGDASTPVGAPPVP